MFADLVEAAQKASAVSPGSRAWSARTT
jgi:hypothetical protein